MAASGSDSPAIQKGCCLQVRHIPEPIQFSMGTYLILFSYWMPWSILHTDDTAFITLWFINVENEAPRGSFLPKFPWREESSKDVNPVSLSSRLLTLQRHTFDLSYWVLLPWPLRALTTLVECRSPNCPWIPLARAKVGEEETEIRTEKGARMRKTLSTRRNCKSQWWKLKCTERIRTR